MLSISPLFAETGVLPTSFSFTNQLFLKQDRLHRLNLFAWGLFAGLGSSAYHTLALIKTPIVVLKFATRITLFNLPLVGSRLEQKFPSLPKGFEYSAPFIHALKIVAYVFSAIFTPFAGLIAPEAALKLHQKLYLVTVESKLQPITESLDKSIAPDMIEVTELIDSPTVHVPTIPVEPPTQNEAKTSRFPPVNITVLEKTVEDSCKKWGMKKRKPFARLHESTTNRHRSTTLSSKGDGSKAKRVSHVDKENNGEYQAAYTVP